MSLRAHFASAFSYLLLLLRASRARDSPTNATPIGHCLLRLSKSAPFLDLLQGCAGSSALRQVSRSYAISDDMSDANISGSGSLIGSSRLNSTSTAQQLSVIELQGAAAAGASERTPSSSLVSAARTAAGEGAGVAIDRLTTSAETASHNGQQEAAAAAVAEAASTASQPSSVNTAGLFGRCTGGDEDSEEDMGTEELTSSERPPES